MFRTVLIFGLIAGGIMSAMFLLALPFHDELGFDRGMIVGYASMVAAFLLVYFGVRSYRDNVAGGSISFGRALAVGVLIALIGSTVYVAMWEVIYYNSSIGTEYMEKYQTYSIEKARAAGATPAELDKQLAEMKKFAESYRNPLVNAAITYLEPLPVGLLFALVSAGLLRRREPTGGAIPA